ncbi:hypothetical protein [Bradyrhizobium sp. BR 1432]|uniref:hypothetical protein n=1 Tax=Bradyrhizobium sp. BR 1432 TaxID=3447966 RepID=UPI003EE63351
MVAITLDLKFRVVPADRQVFIAFPGKGYGLYSTFHKLDRIFPQLPGLELFAGRPFSEQPEILARIARARRLRNWHRSKRQSDPPSRRLSEYDRVDAGLYTHKGVLAGFFERAKKGDLVVVPPGELVGHVLIGELQDAPEKFENIEIPELFDRDEVPTRKVKWLASTPKADLSLGMLRRFPKPNAFTTLDREFYQEIFSLAYGSYSLEDLYVSRFDVTEADFSTIDDYRIQQLFNAVAAMSQQHNLGTSGAREAVHDADGWDGIIDLLTDHSYIPDLSVNINSPGSLTLSCQRTVPLVVAALIALSSLGAMASWTAAQAETITIKNSAAPAGDSCTADVAQETLEQLKLMGYARWQNLCKKIAETKVNTGLKEQSSAK